jgi:uncharacterized short protein YbdD (DUF466 family)
MGADPAGPGAARGESLTRSPTGSGSVGPAALRAWRNLRWWVGSVLGDTAYARYVEHLRRTHPDVPVPTEREYWRQRYAEQDANPGARCC